jgi:CheY-like chemotaxis protein
MESLSSLLYVPASRLYQLHPRSEFVLLELSKWHTFVRQATEYQFLCDLWVARSSLEATTLAAVAVVHAALFAFHMASSDAPARIVASLVSYDSAALVLCGLLLLYVHRKREVIRYWRSNASEPRPHGAAANDAQLTFQLRQLPGRTEGASSLAGARLGDGAASLAHNGSTAVAAEREAPFTRSGDAQSLRYVTSGWHAWHIAALVLLTTTRLSYYAAVQCSSSTSSAEDRACLGIILGAVPFGPTVLCALMLAVYIVFLAEIVAIAYIVVVMAFALDVAAALSLAYAVGLNPIGTSVATFLVLAVLGCGALCGTARYVIRVQRGRFAVIVGLECVDAEREAAREVRLATWQSVHEATAAYVAHQLRNPLHQAAALLAELAANEALPRRAHSDMADMAAALQRMDVVTGEMLTRARAVNGRIGLVSGAVNIVEVVDGLVSLFRSVGYRISEQAGPRAPRIVWCDSACVRQVLDFALKSACEVAGPVGGAVSVRVFPTLCSAGHGVVTHAEYTGQAQAARPFVRVEVRTKRPSPRQVGIASVAGGGQGEFTIPSALGLSISVMLARLMSAHVGQYDELADGRMESVFFLELPDDAPPGASLEAASSVASVSRRQPEAALAEMEAGDNSERGPRAVAPPAGTSPQPTRSVPRAAPSAIELQRVTSAAPSANAAVLPLAAPLADRSSTRESSMTVASGLATHDMLHDLRVLAVDDDEVNRRLMSRYLSRLGCKATTCSDGDQVAAALAAAAAANSPVQAIVMDVVMARMNGDECCRALRMAHCQVPIVAATANATAANREHYRVVGFDSVLAKPFTAAGLASALEAALAARSASTPYERAGRS